VRPEDIHALRLSLMMLGRACPENLQLVGALGNLSKHICLYLHPAIARAQHDPLNSRELARDNSHDCPNPEVSLEVH
jgi:hypothetical protein